MKLIIALNDFDSFFSFIEIIDSKQPLAHRNVFTETRLLVQKLRSLGVNTAVDWSMRKVGDKIKTADRQKIQYTMVVGEDEIKSGQFKLKHLESGEETILDLPGIATKLKAK